MIPIKARFQSIKLNLRSFQGLGASFPSAKKCQV